jgi:hypothetical protein
MSNDGLYQVTPPSTVFTNERKYPVIFAEPSFSQIGALCAPSPKAVCLA